MSGADRLLQLMVSHCVVPADDTPGAPRGEDEGGGVGGVRGGEGGKRGTAVLGPWSDAESTVGADGGRIEIGDLIRAEGWGLEANPNPNPPQP